MPTMGFIKPKTGDGWAFSLILKTTTILLRICAVGQNDVGEMECFCKAAYF